MTLFVLRADFLESAGLMNCLIKNLYKEKCIFVFQGYFYRESFSVGISCTVLD